MTCPMAGSGGGGDMEYSKYLQIPKLLDTVKRESEKRGKPVHDEHLFIRTHQAFELWFHQALFEIKSVMELFQEMPGTAASNENGRLIVCRLQRAHKIIKLTIDQFLILETMTPLDFMDFRAYLFPASGFQSVQFRVLENTLGIREEDRKDYNRDNYKKDFDKQQLTVVLKPLDEPSLLDVVQRWLERIMDTDAADFDFVAEYRKSVSSWQNGDAEKIKPFLSVFEEETYKQAKERKFSYKAFIGALMVTLYRDQPKFTVPYQIITLLVDLDELLAKWRYNHVQMVHRTLGKKTGTGGSSGVDYLLSTICDNYRIFLDLFNLATFLVPHDSIPAIPKDIKKRWHDFQ